MPIWTIPDEPKPLPGKNRGTGGSTGSGAPAVDNSAVTNAGDAQATPVARGRVKLPAVLIEKLPNQVLQPPAWLNATTYRVGELVSSNGNAYRCISSGNSNLAPSGGGSSQGLPYTSGETVTKGVIRANGGNAYICLVGGVCSTFGPTGTGPDIPDAGPVTHWAYLGSAPYAGYVPDFHLVVFTPVVVMAWQYLQALPYNLNYQRPVLALCEGQISKAITIWQDKLQTADDGAGIILPGGWTLLTGPDAGGQVTTGFDATGYQHTAVLVPLAVFGVPTGTQVETPDVAVELDAVTFDAIAVDMNAADHVTDQLTHSRRGFGWPSSRLHSSIGSADPASLRSWSDAKGVRYSHVNDTQRAGVDLMADHSNACNTVFFMSQGKLKAVPLDDTPTTSPVYGSVNYVPNNVSRYNIGPSDIRSGQPVSFSSKLSSDRWNFVPVEYINRAAGYTTGREVSPVLSDARRRGTIVGPTITLPFIFPDGTWAAQLSRVAANSSLYCCRQYSVTVNPRFIALEPGDVVTIAVGESITSYKQVPVRILQVRRSGEGWRTFTCIDYPAGIAAPAAYAPQKGDGLQQNGPNTIGSIPVIYQSASQTNQSPDNLWPNANSEASPPSYIQVLNDGSLPEWDYRVNLAGAASFTGSISVATLTASGVTGTLAIGQRVDGPGVLPATYIVSLGTGTGGAGTYGLNQAQSASGSMTSSGAYSGDWIRQLDNTAGAGSMNLAVKLPCSPGELFTMQAQARSPTGGGSAVVAIAIQFFDQFDNFLAGPTQPSALNQPRWTPLSTASFPAVPAPLGTAYVKAMIAVSAHTLGQFDSIVLRRATQPVHITPGGHMQGLTTDSTGATVWAGDTAWTNATLINSWVTFGGTSPTPGFMRDPGGRVSLRGAVKSGSIPSVAFVLPAGYRPAAALNFACPSNGAFGYVGIDNAGNVNILGGSNVWVDLSGIAFSTL